MGIFDFIFGKEDEKKQTPVAAAPLPMLTQQGSSIINKATPQQIAESPSSKMPVIAGAQADANFKQLRKEATVEPVRKMLSERAQQSVPTETAVDFIAKNPQVVDKHFAQFDFSGMKSKQDQQKLINKIQQKMNMSIDLSEDPVTGKMVASDNASEILKNEAYNLLDTELNEGRMKNFASGIGDTLATGLEFVTGNNRNFSTNTLDAKMIIDLLKESDPVEGQLLEASLSEVESQGARIAGKITGELATSLIPGGIAVKGMRALPVIAKLRAGTTAGRLMAISLENVAFELAAQGFINSRDKKGMEQFMKDVAASPSVLLPYNRKWQFVAGGFADFLAGRAVGMSNEDALTNAAVGAGAGIMQRWQTGNEIGIGALRRKAMEEAEKIHTVVRTTSPSSSTVIKMQNDAVKSLEKEARLLGFKPQDMGSMFGENRMMKFSDSMPGGQNVPDAWRPKFSLPDGIKPGEVVQVPINRITTDPKHLADAQRAIDVNDVHMDAGKPLEATYENGKILLYNGNRRLLEAMKNGDSTVPVTFLNTPKSNPIDEIISSTGNSSPLQAGKASSPEGSPLESILRPEDGQTKSALEQPNIEDSLLSIDSDPDAIITPVPQHNIDEAQALMKEIFPVSGRNQVSKEVGKARRESKNVIKDIIGNPDKVATKNDVQSIVIKDKVGKLKDIKNVSTRFTELWTNTRRVFGESYPLVKEKLLDPLDTSKGERIDFLETKKTSLEKNVTDKFGFERKSKESAAIQTYGESTDKAAALTRLREEFGDAKADQIVQADRWFRAEYDELIDRVNAVRRTIYPDKPPIPKLENYYRHFQDISSSISGIRSAMEGPTNIDPTLEGISAFTTPKTKYLSFGQKRKGGQTEVDAIAGYIDYLESAAYAIYIDPHINKFRAFRKVLAESTKETKNMNNYLRFLEEFSNDLAGKTNPFDREVQNIVGRGTLQVADVVSRRTRENSVLGNAASAVSQVFNIPQSIAEAGVVNSARGMQLTLSQIFDNSDAAIRRSVFLKERYARSHYQGFEVGMLENSKKLAGWITQVGDEISAKYIWNTQYARAINVAESNKKVLSQAEFLMTKDPIKFADDETRRLIGGRGVAEVPIIQKSKLFKMIAPFQLEVTNAARITKDMVTEKQFKKLGTLLVANFVMNRIAEQVRGSPVVYDPIQALIDSISQDNSDESAIERTTKFVGRQAGEIFSNVPGGQQVADLFTSADPRLAKELFGEGDPNRFGGNVMFKPIASMLRYAVQPTPRNLQDALIDPIFAYVTPFGGAQIKKSLQGLAANQQGEVNDRAGRRMFEAGTDPLSSLQSLLFGRYATKEAREYFDSKQGEGDRQILNFLFGESARAGNTRTGTNTRKSNTRKASNTRSSANTR